MNEIEEIIESVPVEIRRELIEQKSQMWKNTVADARLDAAVAAAIEDAALKQQAVKRLKQALQAVVFIEEQLAALPEPEVDEPDA